MTTTPAGWRPADAGPHAGRRDLPRRLLRRPFAVGGALAGALLVALLGQQALLGRAPFGPAGDVAAVWTAVLHCALAGYVPAAFLAVLRSARRELEALGARDPALTRGLEARVPILGEARRGWWVALTVGLVFGVLGPWLTEPDMGLAALWDPAAWRPEVVWHRALGLWITTWMGAFVYATVDASGLLSEAASRIEELDLFDDTAAAPFARQGLTNAFLAAGLFSLVSLLWFDQGLTPLLLIAGTGTMVLTIVALLLPVRSVQRRLQAARAAELAWCAEAIRSARVAARAERTAGESGEHGGAGAPRSGRMPGRLADLVAYRQEVERVRSWPFDTPALRRIALYLLIPLGSWVASAVVQSAVEGILSR